MKTLTINNNIRKELIQAIVTSLKTGKEFYTNGKQIKAYKTSREGFYPVTQLLSKTAKAENAHFIWVNKHLPTVAKIYEWNKDSKPVKRQLDDQMAQAQDRLINALIKADMGEYLEYIM